MYTCLTVHCRHCRHYISHHHPRRQVQPRHLLRRRRRRRRRRGFSSAQFRLPRTVFKPTLHTTNPSILITFHFLLSMGICMTLHIHDVLLKYGMCWQYLA